MKKIYTIIILIGLLSSNIASASLTTEQEGMCLAGQITTTENNQYFNDCLQYFLTLIQQLQSQIQEIISQQQLGQTQDQPSTEVPLYEMDEEDVPAHLLPSYRGQKSNVEKGIPWCGYHSIGGCPQA